MKDHRVVFTLILAVIGFMLAIQFQTTKEPVVRDTRNVLELREELKLEQERYQQLLEEIERYEAQRDNYLLDQSENVDLFIEEALDELREEAGITEVTGEGVILTVEPLYNDRLLGGQNRTVSPQLLQFLMNELNMYNAQGIAIGDQRVVSTTAFRDVNGITHVNGRRIPPLPLEIKVLSDDAEKLHNQMVVSESVDYFAIENLELTSTPINELTLPPYEQTIRVRYMEQVREGDS
ncbi:DUF881 domain-containing protein [Desertibacillus haloalkaliphilus]|uniref:DUF881 domain-containing protein n=1 Tax=Desertibacillus haloalkaliphilus TaxID=1328930 RepID=UPI001C255A7E|nr:DUF881 domain-containing protein [Desertibacillus haloalkaliphilus]MBU8907105.1 DUF881 domain-containing protein [Desertibacillus haloalkaliphilus]